MSKLIAKLIFGLISVPINNAVLVYLQGFM